jgi:hypothetical protein
VEALETAVLVAAKHYATHVPRCPSRPARLNGNVVEFQEVERMWIMNAGVWQEIPNDYIDTPIPGLRIKRQM